MLVVGDNRFFGSSRHGNNGRLSWSNYWLFMLLFIVATLLLSSNSRTCCDAAAFVPSASTIRFSVYPTTSSTRISTTNKQHHHHHQYHHSRRHNLMFMGSTENNDQNGDDRASDQNSTAPLSLSNSSSSRTAATTAKSKDNPILNRFLSPRIDDPALPLSDVLVAQIIAPTLQIAWLGTQGAPSPSWLQPIFAASSITAARGALLAPLLIHGAALASCWLLGALAAEAYQDKAVRLVVAPPPRRLDKRRRSDSSSAAKSSSKDDSSDYGYGVILSRVIQAGAFATGLLILGTQLDLFIEYKGHLVQFGDSPEIDFRLNLAAVEVVNDVVFEAMTLIAWRLGVALQNSVNARY